jgi:hypothetical protein
MYVSGSSLNQSQVRDELISEGITVRKSGEQQ